MSTHTFTIVIEPDEDMFHGYVPALKGCHTFGKTVDETRLYLAEAIELYLEGLLELGETIPTEEPPVLVSQLTVPLAA